MTEKIYKDCQALAHTVRKTIRLLSLQIQGLSGCSPRPVRCPVQPDWTVFFPAQKSFLKEQSTPTISTSFEIFSIFKKIYS